jgi:hypothetical protein
MDDRGKREKVKEDGGGGEVTHKLSLNLYSSRLPIIVLLEDGGKEERRNG